MLQWNIVKSPVPMGRAHRHYTRVVCAFLGEFLKPEDFAGGWKQAL
jgi:hypothetical protein